MQYVQGGVQLSKERSSDSCATDKSDDWTRMRSINSSHTSNSSDPECGPAICSSRRRYFLRHVLFDNGERGSIRVCEVEDAGEQVAAKHFPPNGDARKNLEAARREAAMLKKVFGHPNVVRYQDMVDVEAEGCHVIMELCRGADLVDVISVQGHIPEKAALQICHKLVGAIRFCHKRGVIHQDIKPENVIVELVGTKVASVKLIDFGLAAEHKPGQEHRDVVGTLSYMAPEMIIGPHGGAVDVWGLGMVLYSMLFGCLPFYDEDQEKLAEAILYDDLAFPTEPAVGTQTKMLLRGMLAKDATKRLTLPEVLNHEAFMTFPRSETY